MNLNGKVLLITGGGSGIGAATARTAASLGARVVLLGPDRAQVEAVAHDLDGAAVVGDAADAAAVQQALAVAHARFGGLDGLLACAGAGGTGRLTDCSDAAWQRTLHVSLETARVSARECLPALVARRGAIVFVSSLGALQPPPNDVGYATSKAALIGLARSLACDYGPEVRVNVVCPAMTRTAMADGVMDDMAARLGVSRAEAYAKTTAWIPAQRPAEPDEVAQTIVFLASSWASYVTGATLMVDGGASVMSPRP